MVDRLESLGKVLLNLCLICRKGSFLVPAAGRVDILRVL